MTPPDTTPDQLAARATRGGASLLLSRWYRTGVQLLSTVIVARLLTPDDYGLVAAVTALSGIAMLLQDLGLPTAAVQSRTLDRDQASGLFWVNLTLGLIIAAVLYVLAPVVADFYGRDEITGITRGVALIFIAGGLVAQFAANMRRDMRLSALAAIEVIAATGSLVLTIALAFAGAGYWALVIGLVSMPVLTAFMVIPLSGLRPRLPRPASGLGTMIKFGSGITFIQVLNYASQSVDVIVIAKVHGTVAVGLYSRAYNLLLLPLSQINGPLSQVSIPLLARLQDDPVRFRRALRSCLLLVSYATVPLFAVLGGLAEPVISVVYGPQWDDAAIIFAVLAIAGMFRSYSNLMGWCATSLGVIQRQVTFTLVAQPITIAALVFAVRWGPVGVAAAYAITVVLAVPAAFWWVLRGTHVRSRSLLTTAAPPLALAAALYLGLRLLVLLTPDWPNLAVLGSGLAMAAVLVAAAFLLPVYRRDISELRLLITRARRGTRTVPAEPDDPDRTPGRENVDTP